MNWKIETLNRAQDVIIIRQLTWFDPLFLPAHSSQSLVGTFRESVSMATMQVLHMSLHRFPLGNYHFSLSWWCWHSRPVEVIDYTLNPWLQCFTILELCQGFQFPQLWDRKTTIECRVAQTVNLCKMSVIIIVPLYLLYCIELTFGNMPNIIDMLCLLKVFSDPFGNLSVAICH